jgi:hypothetical protein
MMMIVLLLFLQKQNLANAIYLFGLGTLLSGLGFSLVRKLIKHFEETNLDVEKFMLDGDLRGTGNDNGDPLNGIIYCS